MAKAVDAFGKIDILVNNAAEQHTQDNFEDITTEQFDRTFRTNVYGGYFMSKYALPHMKKGGSILFSTSITAFRGSAQLMDYSATKGAQLGMLRAMSQALAERGIRVNGVPRDRSGPLIPASFDAEKVRPFAPNAHGPARRADEVAPCFVFLASEDASYITGQVLHPNGGEIVA